jgi:predicted RNA-binding Zn ribbon-like protein
VLEPFAGGVDGALGRLLAIVAAAMLTGEWERMRTCDNDSCRWAFYDHSKNQSAHWCGTRCGNLMKARAYRRRKREAAGGSSRGSQ